MKKTSLVITILMGFGLLVSSSAHAKTNSSTVICYSADSADNAVESCVEKGGSYSETYVMIGWIVTCSPKK